MNHPRRSRPAQILSTPAFVEAPRVCSRPAPATGEATETTLTDMIARGYETMPDARYCRACFMVHTTLRLVARADLDTPGAPSQPAYEVMGVSNPDLGATIIVRALDAGVRNAIVRAYARAHRRGAAAMVRAVAI